MDPLNQTISSPPNTAFTPSNFPDKKSVIAAYKRAVNMHLEVPEDRVALQKALKEFQRSLVVEDLVESLKPLLGHPKRRGLFHYIRPLIPARMRDEYNSLLPSIPNYEQKVYHIKRKGSESLGITVRGGFEFGCGIFVSSVQPSSRALQAGLKEGDELIRINGLTLSQATSTEVVNLLKLRKTLTITARSMGILPEIDPANGKMVWKDVMDPKRKFSRPRLESDAPLIGQSTKRLQLVIDGPSVGIRVQTKPSSDKGVVIRDVVPNSPADNAGLKAGDEIVKVDEISVVGVPHDKVIEVLTSKESLMLTVKIDEARNSPGRRSFAGASLMGMFTNPPDTFELEANEFDGDAAVMANIQLDYNDTFLLKAKDGEEGQAKDEKKAPVVHDRLSILEMEADPMKGMPSLGMEYSFGFGPALALPTLQAFMPPDEQAPPTNDVDGVGQNMQSVGGQTAGDTSLISVPALQSPSGGQKSPEMANEGLRRGSIQINMDHFADAPPLSLVTAEKQKDGGDSAATILVGEKEGESPAVKTTASTSSTMDEAMPGKSVPLDNHGNEPSVDFSSFQLPSDSDDEKENENGTAGAVVHPTSAVKPVQTGFSEQKKHALPSAMKKASVSAAPPPLGRKQSKLEFKDNVEIILPRESVGSIGGYQPSDDTTQGVHPSNMEFSAEVLKGRRVAFHTVPKTGPLMISIKGGIDSDEENKGILISGIREGGAAHQYKRLHVGDQILVVDGISLTEVTHADAVAALEKAMNMESVTIDLVVAVSKDHPEDEGEGAEEEDGETSGSSETAEEEEEDI